MTYYNPTYLNYKPIFTSDELNKLQSLSNEIKGGNKDPLQHFLNIRNIEEIGIDFVYGSSQLEGNSYNHFDTLTLLKMGQTAGGKSFSDAVMILNLRESFNLLVKNIDYQALKNDQRVLKDFIKENHSIIAERLVPNGMVGVVRQHSVNITGTNYQPLSSVLKLDQELDYLTKVATESYSNPFEKAVYLHNNIAYLQYFIDGNKRTARNLLTFSLMQEHQFPLLFHVSESSDYIGSLIHYYETGDYSEFKKYFIETYQKTIEKYKPKPDPEFKRDNNGNVHYHFGRLKP